MMTMLRQQEVTLAAAKRGCAAALANGVAIGAGVAPCEVAFQQCTDIIEALASVFNSAHKQPRLRARTLSIEAADLRHEAAVCCTNTDWAVRSSAACRPRTWAAPASSPCCRARLQCWQMLSTQAAATSRRLPARKRGGLAAVRQSATTPPCEACGRTRRLWATARPRTTSRLTAWHAKKVNSRAGRWCCSWMRRTTWRTLVSRVRGSSVEGFMDEELSKMILRLGFGRNLMEGGGRVLTGTVPTQAAVAAARGARFGSDIRRTNTPRSRRRTPNSNLSATTWHNELGQLTMSCDIKRDNET